jgi:hypothetical protein
MNSGTTKINGIRFTDTMSSGAMRYTHRYFIDGKLVAKAIWLAAKAEAKTAEKLSKAEAMMAANVMAAIEDIRPHVPAWIKLLETHIASLPPDRDPSGHDGDDGSSDRGYAEHELRAMKRDLGALLATVS